jgi:hypothetical protein
VFADRDHAEAAIRELKDKHFTDQNIGYAYRDLEHGGKVHEQHGNQAGSGAATGAAAGGIVGGIVGLLVGLGALVIPGVGPVIAGGVLASTLGVAGTTAAVGAGIGIVAGGILGALVGMGIPRHEAEYFEREFNEGRALVTVTAEGRADEAAYILEKHGGDTAGSLYDPTSTTQRQTI